MNPCKHNRPFAFWYTIRDVSWPRTPLCLNDKGYLDLCKDDLELARKCRGGQLEEVQNWRQRSRSPSVPLRLFMHLSSIIRTSVLSPRNLLLTLALVSLRSHTRSSWRQCKFPLCLLTQHSEAFSSSFSLIMLEQLDHVASTGLVQVENQGKGHVGHRCGSSGGYWSSVTISLTRRESSVP
jgi:hypothetical protein